MSGTVTHASSSLASELLLNKIMNNQVETSTGRSITAAGRALSSKLSSEAYALRAAEKNMIYGEGLVSAAQNELSGIRDQLNSLKSSLQDIDATNGLTKGLIAELAEEMNEGKAQIDKALKSKYNNVELLTGGGSAALNAGNGMSIKVLADNVNDGTALKEALGALTSITNAAKVTEAITKIDSAIEEILGQEAKYSADIKALQNRQILLADHGASLDSAASAQSLMANNGASNLLNAMLGNTEV